MAPKNTVKKVSNFRKSSRIKAIKNSRVRAMENTKTETEVKEHTAADVFTTFSSNVILKDGLNIIRSLGRGKYEILNLTTVSQNVIGSTEMAELISSVPERRVALDIDSTQWNAAMLKCNVAVRITQRDLFRFFALPLELRRKIYKLVMFNPQGMYLRARHRGCAKPFRGLSLMLTCREIYEETNKVFLSNTFKLDHWAIIELRTNTEFAKKLQDIEFDWWGKWADSAIFQDIAAYPNLRILNIKFWAGAITFYPRSNPNRLFQDDENIRWFSHVRGFDALVSLRGLTKVTFDLYGSRKDSDSRVTDSIPVAKKSMGELLNRELTQPKPLPAAKGTKGQASKSENRADTDDENSEQEYIPRPTKSRRGIVVDNGW